MRLVIPCLLLFLSTPGWSLNYRFLQSTPNLRPESVQTLRIDPAWQKALLRSRSRFIWPEEISRDSAYLGCSIHILFELLVWTAHLIHHETWTMFSAVAGSDLMHILLPFHCLNRSEYCSEIPSLQVLLKSVHIRIQPSLLLCYDEYWAGERRFWQTRLGYQCPLQCVLFVEQKTITLYCLPVRLRPCAWLLVFWCLRSITSCLLQGSSVDVVFSL